MATVADIVTGILVTELAADDDMMMSAMNEHRHIVLKNCLMQRKKYKKKLMHQYMHLLSWKKKPIGQRKRKRSNKGDSSSNCDHDYNEAIIPRFTTNEYEEFRNHFQMERSTFDKILQYVGPKFGNQDKSSLPVERKVLVALWLLSSQESFRSIGEKFGLQKSTTYYAFLQFVNALHSISKAFIFWPDGESMAVITGEFERHFVFPGVVGVVSACQIPVKISPVDDNFESRAEPYSTVALQAICDHRMRFMDVFIGCPQPAHAVTCTWKFFEGSNLGKNLCANEWEIPPDYHLLGDSTYPLRSYLLTPYKEENCITEERKKFNTSHRSIRKIIHKAFGLLRTKFARLKYIDTSRYDLVPQIIMAACVLHNIILEEEEEIQMPRMAEDHDYNDDHVHPCPQADHHVDDEAVLKRDAITKRLFS